MPRSLKRVGDDQIPHVPAELSSSAGNSAVASPTKPELIACFKQIHPAKAKRKFFIDFSY